MSQQFECKVAVTHFVVSVQLEPGEDPEVVRAKYFIRDEFLVSTAYLLLPIL